MTGTSREKSTGSTIPALKLGGSLAPSSRPFRLARVPSAQDKISCRHTFALAFCCSLSSFPCQALDHHHGHTIIMIFIICSTTWNVLNISHVHLEHIGYYLGFHQFTKTKLELSDRGQATTASFTHPRSLTHCRIGVSDHTCGRTA